MPKKVYLASPFFNDEQIERIEKVESALTNNASVSEYYSPRLDPNEEFEFGSVEWRKAVYAEDVRNIDTADAVIAVVDFEGNYVDPGTAWEVGYAHGTNKPVVIFKEKNESMLNLMISDSLTAYIETFEQVESYDFDKMERIDYTGKVF